MDSLAAEETAAYISPCEKSLFSSENRLFVHQEAFMTASACRIIRGLSMILVMAVCLALSSSDAAATNLVIYSEGLTAGWQDRSWNSTVYPSNTSPVHGGQYSLSVKYIAPRAGLYLHTNIAVDTGAYDHLSFWINGGSVGNQQLNVVANGNGSSVYWVAAQANTWMQVNIPLSALGNPATLTDIYWQDITGGAQPIFYLDDISLISSTGTPPPTLGIGPALSIDVNSGRHTISSDIYGMNYADEQLAAELRLPVRRWGGNSTSRYNWETNLENAGSDWYFENLPVGNVNVATLPDGSASDQFVEQDLRTGTRTLLTIPLIGWTVKSSSPRSHPFDCGFKVTKYGTQQSVDPWDTNCGDGLYANGTDITGNDPTDTSMPISPDFESAWISHLTAKYGTAMGGGVAYYDLDNEPMLWSSTHRDVHPQPTTYDEMRDRTYQYAWAIKTADPTAKTLGPVAWGWCEYFYSALDGCSAGVDYQTHGNMPYVAWYLQQMSAYEQQHGRRILDYLDLHYYPQASGVSLAPVGSASIQALRLRSTRSLWDASYIDESWIGVAVRLLPRMRNWVNTYYPGSKLAITEYNWGGMEDINGALAQADVLGIFGLEGLDLAALWDPPTAAQPGAFAFRMYRNYDGAGHGFGDVSVLASSADQSSLAVYAAQRSVDSALTVMIINKTANSLTSSVHLTGLTLPPSADVYQYSAANLAAIQHLTAQQVSAGGFSTAFPGNSITLLVLATGGGPLVQEPIAIPSMGATTASTMGSTGALQEGYAILNVSTGSTPFATAVFSVTQNGVVVSEAGVPASPPTTHAQLFVDYRTSVAAKSNPLDTGTINIDTGMALVNRGTATANITFTLHDRTGDAPIT
ncbi:MAG: glycoside hydrolase family 44 protein, partial [Acidobacteriia bacterium]|nr:glycoside hydrolase family 44 protein [Terriglobia bacterium]